MPVRGPESKAVGAEESLCLLDEKFLEMMETLGLFAKLRKTK